MGMVWSLLLGVLLLATALARRGKRSIHRNGQRLKYVLMAILP